MATPRPLILHRWTPEKTVEMPLPPYLSQEKLIRAEHLRSRLFETATHLKNAQEACESLGVAWRRGLFFFGPAGSGKTAAAQALALHLGWKLLVIPGHEILSPLQLEHALAEVCSLDHGSRIILLENVDRMYPKMEPEVFFDLLDEGFSSVQGALWIATTKHASVLPKAQLVRPGRFDETFRFEPPSAPIRAELIRELPMPPPDTEALEALVDRTADLSYAHFEEMRCLCAQAIIANREMEIGLLLEDYFADQLLARERAGILSDDRERLDARIQQMDPRLLLAAMDMNDSLRRVMEKVLGDSLDRINEAKTADSLTN